MNKWKFIDEPLKERLKKNSITNVIYFLLTLPIMFVLTPVIIKTAGAEEYGIWVLAGTILVFIELIANFQASSALSVMVPRVDPKKEPEKINIIINTLLGFYAVSAVLVCALYYFADDLILRAFFKTSPEKAGLAARVMALSLYPFMANFLIMGIGYLAGAFNIFYMTNIVHIIISYLRAALMLWALKAGLGITGIVYAQMGTLIIESLIIIFICKAVFPPLRISFKMFSWDILSYMLKLSAKLFTAKAANVLSSNFDRLALGIFVNPAAAGIYQLGAGVSKNISNLPEMLGFASLLPAASELKRNNKEDAMRVMAERVTKYTALAGIFLASSVVSFSRDFIKLWLGHGYEDVYLIMSVLACAYAVLILAYPMQNILNGTGHEKKAMSAGVISSAVTVVLTSLFTWKYGVKGAAVAAFLSSSATLIVFFAYYVSLTGHTINIFKYSYKPLIIGGVLFIPMHYISVSSSWIVFFAAAGIYTLLFIAIAQGIFRVLDKYEMDIITKRFKTWDK